VRRIAKKSKTAGLAIRRFCKKEVSYENSTRKKFTQKENALSRKMNMKTHFLLLSAALLIAGCMGCATPGIEEGEERRAYTVAPEQHIAEHRSIVLTGDAIDRLVKLSETDEGAFVWRPGPEHGDLVHFGFRGRQAG